MVRSLLNLCGWKRPVAASTPLPAIPLAPDWTEEHASHLLTFLKNPTGQALLQRARAKQAADCIEACKGGYDPRMAAGFSHAIDWLESLAIISSNPASARSNDAADSRDSETSGAAVPEFALP